jgi:hypothetical protein
VTDAYHAYRQERKLSRDYDTTLQDWQRTAAEIRRLQSVGDQSPAILDKISTLEAHKRAQEGCLIVRARAIISAEISSD